ncbi:PIN domain-containing protein [Limnobacter sp. P1]|uniref:PIN domain-containing protein n=1 Tax=Limnobacter olei TaxID=3031298 RepID=UPI0023B0D6A5|nr:PIN domain-containing protein [Limnobacter sp. P1]
MKKTYMLDTNICSFIIKERPESVLLRLQNEVEARSRFVISAITYAELIYGAKAKKASPKSLNGVREFVERIDEVLPWDRAAVDKASDIKQVLEKAGTPIGANDTAIAGHALAIDCVLVTNNMREFSRVPDLNVEDWV